MGNLLPNAARLAGPGTFQVFGGGRANGRNWFVGNSTSVSQYQQELAANAAGHGVEMLKPYSSVKQLLTDMGSASSGRGDTIWLLPGHAESIPSAAYWDFTTRAGVKVRSLDPDNPATITFDTIATATIQVASTNVCFEDIDFVNAIDELAIGIDVNAGSTGFRLRRCRFTCTATNIQTISMVDLAAVDDMAIDDCEFWATVGAAAAGGSRAINFSGAATRTKLRRNTMVGYWTANVGGIRFAAAALQVDIDGNYIYNMTASGATDACISVGANAVTGVIRNNRFRLSTDGAVAPILDTGPAGLYSQFDNYVVNNNTERGLIVGTASA